MPITQIWSNNVSLSFSSQSTVGSTSAIVALFQKQGNAGSRADWRAMALLKHNPASYALFRILSGPKAGLEKREYLQHNPCHIFVTSMLTQKHNKSQPK
jgi:hypothetical protein